VSSLVNQKITFGTIKVYLAAVQYQNMMLGYPERLTNMLQLYELVHGVRRTQGNIFAQPDNLLHVYSCQLMIQFLHESSYSESNCALLQAAMLLPFLGCFECPSLRARQGIDLVNLLVTDIRFNTEGKTDPFRMGVTLRPQ